MSRAASLRVSTSDTSTTDRPDTSRRESRLLRVLAYIAAQPHQVATLRDCIKTCLRAISLSSGGLLKIMEPAIRCGWVAAEEHKSITALSMLVITQTGLDALNASVLGGGKYQPAAADRLHFGEFCLPIKPGPRSGSHAEPIPPSIGAPLPRDVACHRHWIPSRYGDTLRWRGGHQCQAADMTARARIEALLRESSTTAGGIHHPTVTA